MGKSKKVFSDLLWSIGAMLLYNGTVQVFVYPFLQRRMGTSAYGDMLFQMAVITVVGAGIGTTASNFRLINQADRTYGNSDYLTGMIILLTIALIPAAFLLGNGLSWEVLAGCIGVSLFVCLRFYSDVAYRLTLHYRTYFLYYTVLAGGYVCGLLLWTFTHSWILTFLLGEIVCVLFCVLTGNIYNPLPVPLKAARCAQKMLPLAASYLLYHTVIQMDRVLLHYTLDSSAVTSYYVASLIGKTLALLVGPLNTVLLSYLSKTSAEKKTELAKKLLGATICISIAFYAFTVVAAPIVRDILYPGILCDDIMNRANLGQVLCFSSSIILVILLALLPSYWQLISQGLYFGAFLICGWAGATRNGLSGFVDGALLANTIRFAAAAAIVLVVARRKPEG